LRIGNSYQRAALQFHLAGTLNMQGKQLHRIIHPDKFDALAAQRTAHINFRAAVVRNKFVALHPADYIAAILRRPDQQIGRRAIKGIFVLIRGGKRAFQKRFVIAGKKRLSVCSSTCRQINIKVGDYVFFQFIRAWALTHNFVKRNESFFQFRRIDQSARYAVNFVLPGVFVIINAPVNSRFQQGKIKVVGKLYF